MSSSSRWRLPLAASVVFHRWRQDPVGMLVRLATELVRRTPSTVLDRAAQANRLDRTWRPGGRWWRLVQVIVADVRGDTATLQMVAHHAATADRGKDVLPLAAVLVALDRPALADQLLAARPTLSPKSRLIAARSAWAAGNWTRALTVAADVNTPAARRVRRVWAALADTETSSGLPDRGGASSTYDERRRSVRPPSHDRLDVLHLVTNSLPWTQAGYTVRTHEIVSAQQQAGLRAAVMTRLGFPVTAGHLRAANCEEINGVRYYRALPRWLAGAPGSAPWHRQAVEMTTRLVQRTRPQVLHAATDHLNGQVALAVRQRTGVPVVYEVRGFLEDSWASRRDGRAAGPDPTEADRYRIARARETQCMREADLVVTLGEEMQAEIVARGVDPARVLVVPNAVDDRFLRPATDPTDGRAVRRQWGLSDDELVVGTLSTFYPHEGLDVLLAAIARLRATGTPVRALLVGDGPEASHLRALSGQLGLAGQVIFTGRVPPTEAPSYHAALDVFAVPRLRARVTELVTPLKPVEALAVGRPLVVSDVAPLRRLAAASGAGLVCRAGDAESLAEAIRTLCYAPARREQMGRTGHAYVAAELTWATMARRYQAAYADLTRKVPPRLV